MISQDIALFLEMISHDIALFILQRMSYDLFE